MQPSMTLEEMLQKLFEDMYYGDGQNNLSMTTRMTIMENSVKSINKSFDKLESAIFKLFLASLTTALSVIASIILRYVFHI